MQTCRFSFGQFALRPKVWWSSTVSSRTFSVCPPVWNKLPKTLEPPEPAESKDSEQPKSSQLSNDSKIAKDIEKRELQRLRNNETERIRKALKYATDPVWRLKHLAVKSACQSARYISDPEWRARNRQQKIQVYNAKYREDQYFPIKSALRSWIYKAPTTRDRLSWKSHVPVLTAEKVEHHCASCRMRVRGGYKLWWQRKLNTEQAGHPLYDCNACFSKDSATALPEGFEDVKTVQQLFLRREQLLGIKAHLRKNALPSPPPSNV
jgi:hypothetical protein